MELSRDRNSAVPTILRLKRYEQPPPRYFQEFSMRVIARIEAGEGRPAWWERFGFDLRGVLTAGAGAVACSFLVLGFGVGVEDPANAFTPSDTSPAFATAMDPVGEHLRATALASTNPVFTSQSAGFANPWKIQVTPASYQIAR